MIRVVKMGLKGPMYRPETPFDEEREKFLLIPTDKVKEFDDQDAKGPIALIDELSNDPHAKFKVLIVEVEG